MQANILWSGREYYSLENCLVNTTREGSEINSIIVGKYEGKIYRVEYQIRTNQNWETIYCELKSQHSNKKEYWRFEKDGKGNWLKDGEQADQFKGCIDVDIPLTPFTNTLPIKRLRLNQNEEQEIKVIYLDVLERKIAPVKQKYKRLSNTEYHYENVPNDFEAVIEVDQLDFVVDYPSLFVRTEILLSDYR
jgi:hypothetical protein